MDVLHSPLISERMYEVGLWLQLCPDTRLSRATSWSRSRSASPAPPAWLGPSLPPAQLFPPTLMGEEAFPPTADSSMDSCLLPRSVGRERVLRAREYDLRSTGRSVGGEASRLDVCGGSELTAANPDANLSTPPRCSCCCRRGDED